MRLIDSDALIEELNNSHFPGAPYVDAGISIAIGKVLDAPTIEPSAQPDLSGYSDRLWKAAYERGKAEAQADIIHCGECKYYHDSDGCFFSTATTRADGFCHWAERKEGEADGRSM